MAPDRFLEWLMSRRDPRFAAYRPARLAYEQYLASIKLQAWETLDHDDYERARQSEALNAAADGFREAISLSRDDGAFRDVAAALCELGCVQHLQGRFDKAVASFEEALRIFQAVPQLTDAQHSGQSECLYHIGVIALAQGKIPAAREALERALEIDSDRGDVGSTLLDRQALDACAKGGVPRLAQPWPAADDPTAPAGTAPEAASLPARPLGRSNRVRDRPAVTPHPGGQWSSPPETWPRRRPVLWIISHTRGANDEVCSMLLAALSPGLRPTVTLSCLACGEEGADRMVPDPIPPDAEPHGVILVLERGGWDTRAFRTWADWSMTKAQQSAAFRLLLVPQGLDRADLEAWAGPTPADGHREASRELLRDLLDVAHLGDSAESDLRVFAAAITDYDRLRGLERWQRFHTTAAIAFGRLAQALLLLAAALLVLTAAVTLLKGDRGAGARLLSNLGIGASLATVILFALWGQCMVPLLALLGRQLKVCMQTFRHFQRWWTIGWLGSFSVVALTPPAAASISWVALGIVAGLVLDIVRRRGWTARRLRFSLDQARLLADNRKAVEALARPNLANLFRVPLRPALAPRIFISYARASAWGRESAQALQATLQAQGRNSFLDREAIDPGRNWRRALDAAIANADVFICLVDEVSVARRMVAAEALSALAGLNLTGGPAILLVTKPGLRQEQALSSALPVVPLLLARGGEQDRRIHVAQMSADSSSILTGAFAKGRYESTALLSGFVSLFLAAPLAIVAVTVGTLGTAIGWICLLFLVPGLAPLRDAVATTAMLPAVVVVGGYLLGFVARLIVASAVELRHTHRTMLLGINQLAVAGLVAGIGPLVRQASSVTIAWSALACVAGWLMASSFATDMQFAGRYGSTRWDPPGW